MTIDQILRAAELSGIARSETQNPEYIFVATSEQLAAWAEKLQATASAMREPPKNTLYLVGYDAEGKRVVTSNMTSFDPQRDARVMGAAWEFNNAGERGVSVLAHHIENLVISVVPKKGADNASA